MTLNPGRRSQASRSGNLPFKKAVATASRRSKEAFVWTTAIENATSLEELDDNGGFEELDAKLLSDIDITFSGEFRKQVRVL